MRGLMVMTFALALAFASGCSGPDKPTWLSINPNQWANRGDADDPIEFAVNGPIAVDVESFSGDVIISANPKLKNHGTVTVVREAMQGYGRTKEAKASLADIHYTAEIVPGALGQSLQVRTSTANAEPHFQRANIYIELPEIDGVIVHTTNGLVHATSISGPVDISTSEHDVRVMTNLAMNKAVNIINRNGDIDYRIRGESQGAFDAQTINGKVSYRVRYGIPNVLPETRNDRLLATLNSGTNPVTLRTVNGDIRIAVIHNPEQIGATIID